MPPYNDPNEWQWPTTTANTADLQPYTTITTSDLVVTEPDPEPFIRGLRDVEVTVNVDFREEIEEMIQRLIRSLEPATFILDPVLTGRGGTRIVLDDPVPPAPVKEPLPRSARVYDLSDE